MCVFSCVCLFTSFPWTNLSSFNSFVSCGTFFVLSVNTISLLSSDTAIIFCNMENGTLCHILNKALLFYGMT